MLTHVDENGRVTAKGQTLLMKGQTLQSRHVPKHITGYVRNGIYYELPDHEKTYTKDGSPVYDEHGRLIGSVHGVCID